MSLPPEKETTGKKFQAKSQVFEPQTPTQKENDINMSNYQDDATPGSLKSRLRSFRKHDTNIGKYNSPDRKSPMEKFNEKTESAIKLANKMLSPEKKKFNRFLEENDPSNDPMLKF